jgi:UDP-GlcNAc3NAcA epimerase
VKRIVTVVGARPQFIKAAVLSRLIRSEEYRDRVSEILVHTGQHYDENMSEIFFREMMIPEPDYNLGIGGSSHGKMTGEMLVKIEEVLVENEPDLVLVYGDTNSTLAGALAASKLHIPVAHVEAGLRSFNMAMPEEQNRVLTDHLSSYLFCPTDTAVQNLKREGIPRLDSAGEPARVEKVGDIMLDASLFYREITGKRPNEKRAACRLNLPGKFFLLTIHRAENTDDAERLRNIIDALNSSSDIPIVFPIHPRTRKILANQGIRLASHIKVIDPVGYFDMLELEESCEAVITDSGGVQKEAYFFKRPCITLRDQTEWVETVDAGWNTIVGADSGKIREALSRLDIVGSYPDLYGVGDCAVRIIENLRRL